MDDRLRGECLEYFRNRPVFGKILRGFREKYLSYGNFVGTVTVKKLTESEREDLEGFLQRNYHGKKSAAVSAEGFEKALAESRFAGISGKEVLELYFQETLEGKKEQRQKENRKWARLLDKVKEGAGTLAGLWVDELKDSESTYIKKRFREAGQNYEEAERLLSLGVRILDGLAEKNTSGSAVYLAVFAAEVTGNPHAFYDGTKDGKYLEMLVKWYLQKVGGEIAPEEDRDKKDGVFPAFRKQSLYLQAGILRDDVSNYAMAAGIRAEDQYGKFHMGMEGFLEEGDPVQIPLSVIAGWKSAVCPGGRIYIVENPSVYAVLCGKWNRSCGLMCMNGQPRFSSLLLLDLLAKAGTEAWYAGDIDPEGLLIAQKLKQYYRGSFHFWHMFPEEYERCVSEETISPRRLRMLEHVTDPELRETAKALQGKEKAGYQENMVQVYMEIF